jgi:phosphopantetheine adenylyltransferase
MADTGDQNMYNLSDAKYGDNPFIVWIGGSFSPPTIGHLFTAKIAIKAFEEGSETMSKEANSQLAIRQEKFIRDLKNALFRVENKTYGICKVTGKLIGKERLKIVPHATMSIEAKNLQR